MGCGTRWFVFSIVMLSSALGEEVIKLSTLSVWIRSVPKKVCVFTWLETRGAILTTGNLKKRRIIEMAMHRI